jgi:hypothetical protein
VRRREAIAGKNGITREVGNQPRGIKAAAGANLTTLKPCSGATLPGDQPKTIQP